jgi:hypothetical protein
MSEAYLAGTLKHLPAAEIRFDRYAIRSDLSKAIDEVRRAEATEHRALLENTRYLWLKLPSNLTRRQQGWLGELLCQPLDTVRAYELGFGLRPSINSMIPPGAGLATPLGHRGRQQRDRAAGQVRRGCSRTTGWGSPLASQPSAHRAARGTQLAHPGSQTPSSWMPHQP